MIALVGNGPSSWWLTQEWVELLRSAGYWVGTMNLRKLPGDGVFFHDAPPCETWMGAPPDGRTILCFRKSLKNCGVPPYPENWIELPEALDGSCCGRVALWWAMQQEPRDQILLVGYDGEHDDRTIETSGNGGSKNAHRNWCRKMMSDHRQALADRPRDLVMVLDHAERHSLEDLPARRITSEELREKLKEGAPA